MLLVDYIHGFVSIMYTFDCFNDPLSVHCIRLFENIGNIKGNVKWKDIYLLTIGSRCNSEIEKNKSMENNMTFTNIE